MHLQLHLLLLLHGTTCTKSKCTTANAQKKKKQTNKQTNEETNKQTNKQGCPGKGKLEMQTGGPIDARVHEVFDGNARVAVVLAPVCSKEFIVVDIQGHLDWNTNAKHTQTSQWKLPVSPMHTCTNAQVHKCTNAHMHTCTHAHMHKYTNAQMHKCTNPQMHKSQMPTAQMPNSKYSNAKCQNIALVKQLFVQNFNTTSPVGSESAVLPLLPIPNSPRGICTTSGTTPKALRRESAACWSG